MLSDVGGQNLLNSGAGQVTYIAMDPLPVAESCGKDGL